MKVLLTTLNSKYIHTNLALRYLKLTIEKKYNTCIREFTINEHNADILREIIQEKADIVAFSCYIWNIENTLKLCADLKKINPKIKIILGGPEVSYNAEEIYNSNPYIDYIITGEGEEVFPKMIDDIKEEKQLVKDYRYHIVEDLSQVKSPYEEFYKEEYANKLLYYETSRGCPFKCAYCLSSTTQGVRFFPMDKVKRELKKFLDARIRTVKFLDRTFNINTDRTLELWKFIVDNNKGSICHFEIEPVLLNDKMLKFLKTVPKGMFNFEIGVQTTNKETLRAIDRNDDIDKVFEIIKELRQYNNIHLHLDLIAGLPKENFESFKKSFNEVYSLDSEVIQLGFLKLLHGTKLRNEEKDEYIFSDNTPYEVFSNKYISYEEILELKKVEQVLEIYKNSGRFESSLKFLVDESPFDFYKSLGDFWEERGLFRRKVSGEEAFDVLYEYYKSKGGESLELFADILKFDYIKNYSTKRAWFNNVDINIKKLVNETIGNKEFVEEYLTDYIGDKDIFKKIKLEFFSYDVMGDCAKKDNIIFLNNLGTYLCVHPHGNQ